MLLGVGSAITGLSGGDAQAIDQLAGSDARHVFEDRDGSLWFATARGVMRYEPQTGASEWFDTSRGLADNDARWTLRFNDRLLIAENEPYLVQLTHYTVPHHAEAHGLPYVELEIRQDLVTQESGQTEWAQRIAQALQEAERIYHERWGAGPV